ncbi:MAG TPA: hypothetical protein VH234_05290 [Candidatus Saccharimonadales bacterium]|jgi:hypothetical protein|nr:hypothetical protein [Candidatus Saccharimonadales bacterium]
MTKLGVVAKADKRLLLSLVSIAILLAGLLLYKLGSLTSGLSPIEVKAATSPVGWHGIYHNPLYLPLKLVRSVVFFFFKTHGQTLTRLPNALFGGLAILTFASLIRLWHSGRTALLTSLLFATSAWVLHVSRLASFDVMYLWAMPTLLLANALVYRYSHRGWAVYGSLIMMGLLLYVPGMVWLIVINLIFLRKHLAEAWRHFGRPWQRSLFGLVTLLWLPLLILDLTRPGQLTQWLGLPAHWSSLKLLVKHFVAVPAHLLVRGPQLPEAWLGKAMVLDVFSLVLCLLGIYFYARHLKAGRSRLLLAMAIGGWVLVSLGGPVGLSLLVPLLYVAIATGLAYLSHEWLQVFPLNPLARGLGLALLSMAVALACWYNLRAYFVAWPHDPTTQVTFQYKR